MFHIALIAFGEPVLFQYWRVLTDTIILPGFIRLIHSLSARTKNLFPILQVTTQYTKAAFCTGARNPQHETKQEYELELEQELEPKLGA
jgi:hypothetical protein